jgi:hypothetical protein
LIEAKSTGGKNGYWTHHKIEKKRICYSHEYIGENNKSYDPKNNAVKDSQFGLF